MLLGYFSPRSSCTTHISADLQRIFHVIMSNDIKCVLHDDLGRKNRTTRYNSRLSQFYSYGTYSVLSQSPSIIVLSLARLLRDRPNVAQLSDPPAAQRDGPIAQIGQMRTTYITRRPSVHSNQNKTPTCLSFAERFLKPVRTNELFVSMRRHRAIIYYRFVKLSSNRHVNTTILAKMGNFTV